MKKQYKIQLPKGKKVTMTNVNSENGVMTVNVELENKEETISEAEKVIKHLRSIDWDKRTKESVDRICDELYHKKHPESFSNYKSWKRKFGDIKEQKYEPKDGDFVYVKARCGYIAIFKEIKGKVLYSYAYYCMETLKVDTSLSITLCLTSDMREIRPATEEEKKLLIDKLAEAGKLWNEEKKCLEDVRWRAKEDELFYVVDFNARVDSIKDIHNWFTNLCYETGNYFKTREAAEKAAEQIRNIFKNSKSE